MTTNRKEVRQMLLAIISGGAPSVQTCVPYQTDPRGRSPFVSIVSAGASRKMLSRLGSKIYIGIHVYVLHANEASNWTEENAEDALDQVELEIVNLLAVNQTNSVWQSVDYDAPSVADKVTVGGVPYLYEVLPLVVEVVT